MRDGTVLLPVRPTSASKRQRRRRRDFAGQARSVRVAPRARRLKSEMLQWALRSGRSVDLDAAVVLIDVLVESDEPSVFLSDDVVTELVWVDAVQWCENHGVELPAGFGATVHAIIDFLAASGRVDPDSDSMAELHEVVDGVGAPGPPRTRRRPLPIA